MFGKTEHIHLVGIGGAGMSGIAEVLLTLGFEVSGSDLVASEAVSRLGRLGARTFIGHRADNLSDADVVVVSSAIPPDNVEVLEARSRAIPIIPRAEMLAELMRMKEGVAVAGAHGKTTAASMVAAVLSAGGMDPTAVIGGVVNSLGANARLGSGRVMVAEADESDGSFLRLSPTVCVVTNIDEEHLDHYRDLEEIKAAFLDFINRVPFYGLAVLCLDQPNIQGLLPRVVRRYVTYGFTPQADFTARVAGYEELETRFVAYYRGKVLGPLTVRMPGVHNVANALASVAVGLEFDIPFHVISEALGEFRGVRRRFEVKGEVRDVLLVDDYGHHPTEIKATIQAARAGWGDRRIVVVFQPHRYTRTYHLLSRFYTAFHGADVVIVTAIYPAGEQPISGVDARKVAEGMRRCGHRQVHYVEEKGEIPAHLLGLVRSGDMVLTLGAGDIGRVGEAFLKRWEEAGGVG